MSPRLMRASESELWLGNSSNPAPELPHHPRDPLSGPVLRPTSQKYFRPASRSKPVPKVDTQQSKLGYNSAMGRQQDGSAANRGHLDVVRGNNPATPLRLGDQPGDNANSVLGKARLILEAFQIDDDGLSLSELARRTGVPKASVHRLAQELLEWGVLERTNGDYCLGIRLFEIGSRVPRVRVLRETVRPFMADLHTATKETIHLAVLDGLEVLFVERANGYRQAPAPSRFAGRMPLHCSSSGKVMLAYSPPELLESVIAQGLSRRTRATIVSPNYLAEQVRRVRSDGFAIEREEIVVGYLGIAVPLFAGTDLELGALSMTVPTFRANIPRHLAALQGARRQIESVNHVA